MSRALAPWLVPAALLVGLLAVAVSPVVGAVALVAVIGVALRLLSSLSRSGDLPQMFQGDGDLPRWARFDPPGRDSGESGR